MIIIQVIRNDKLRKVLRIALPCAVIPGAVAAGVFLFDEKKYAWISLAVAALSYLLFLCGFEKKQTGSRRLILAAVLTALASVGRLIPFFKPVTALTMLAGMYLGGEAGFLVGSLSALISNFYFGQGPWTPFQMLAWGLIGLLAGVLAAPLKKSSPLRLLYGALAGVLFSMVMDIWTVLWYNGTLNWPMYLSALATAVPYTVLYAVSNVVFLLLCAKPFGEKLERIRVKYGI